MFTVSFSPLGGAGEEEKPITARVYGIEGTRHEMIRRVVLAVLSIDSPLQEAVMKPQVSEIGYVSFTCEACHDALRLC